jgi:hypothetical protein
MFLLWTSILFLRGNPNVSFGFGFPLKKSICFQRPRSRWVDSISCKRTDELRPEKDRLINLIRTMRHIELKLCLHAFHAFHALVWFTLLEVLVKKEKKPRNCISPSVYLGLRQKENPPRPDRRPHQSLPRGPWSDEADKLVWRHGLSLACFCCDRDTPSRHDHGQSLLLALRPVLLFRLARNLQGPKGGLDTSGSWHIMWSTSGGNSHVGLAGR